MAVMELLNASVPRLEPGRVKVRAARRGELLEGDGLLSWFVSQDGSISLVHNFTPTTLRDDTLVGALSSLVDIGALAGQAEFEAAAVEIIQTSGPTASQGWKAFYDNTLRSLSDGTAAFAPIHRRARSLVEGESVLEVGSCFGFLAIQFARDGRAVSACDVSPGAISLLDDASRRYGLSVNCEVADATALPYPSASVDTVTLIHLLEHLESAEVLAAVSEALRVARRTVVIAVPLEETPSEHFGHRQRVTMETLHSWADQVAHAGAEVFADHGGWLVLRPVSEPVQS
ncbi:mycofactocin oligosaccharide methyltransferase MftM [Gordonia sp. LUNF6]|uniref:Methyltransferase type 11 domain-containing protein n=3 Tax=Gordoniaceae TaxID=85026 RepID=L7LMR0_9ACTN|nr:methyltransferase type 11 [Gordonia sihwensis]GAC61392.1 hypothetical protein GSI01S_16_01190 [Gordonia sihwensis NBRC 108236]